MQETPVQLLEEDFRKLFHPKSKRVSFLDIFFNLFRSLIYFFILYGFFFVLINSPAYITKLKYFWRTEVQNREIPKSDNNLTLLKPASVITPTIPTMPNGQSIDQFLLSHVPNNHVVIPKINVDAPVTWEAPEDTILADLEKGLAQYQGTALPGENGNVFVVGHSSNYWWDKGLFNQVFALLDKVNNGDRIYVTYNNKPYVYQVESIKVVKPNDIEVLNPTDHSVITLMTCTPVGTTLNRLIVQAKQIYPTSNTKSNTKTISPNSLPAVR
jgi:LPXTG-site transpeptidase (sortase) family protein